MATIFMLLLLVLLSSSASAASDDAFLSLSVLAGADELHHPGLATARTLLQALQPCPVDFENLNYTVVTSRCKGPKYPAKFCCTALRDLACPYSNQVNNLQTNCADTMFSYINLYGKYPPGLFANVCRDSKRGLECSASQSGTASGTLPTAILRFRLLLLFVSAATFLTVYSPFL